MHPMVNIALAAARKAGEIIARAADAGAIHYRMLNRSKGSAVQGPRVQADRKRFKAAQAPSNATSPLWTTPHTSQNSTS